MIKTVSQIIYLLEEAIPLKKVIKPFLLLSVLTTRSYTKSVREKLNVDQQELKHSCKQKFCPPVQMSDASGQAFK